jgi:hypothetical protein
LIIFEGVGAMKPPKSPLFHPFPMMLVSTQAISARKYLDEHQLLGWAHRRGKESTIDPKRSTIGNANHFKPMGLNDTLHLRMVYGFG